MKTSKSLIKLAIPALLAGSYLLAPQASAERGASDHPGLGIGGKLPHSINLAELEARSLEHFAELDSNSDGLINTEEFAASTDLQRGGKGRHHRGAKFDKDGHGDHRGRHKPTAEEKEAFKAELFSRLDADNNGELSNEEFAAGREVRMQLRKEQHRQSRFQRLDQNGDQQVSLEEFQLRLEKMRALDTDADGTVSRAELRTGIKERRSTAAQSK